MAGRMSEDRPVLTAPAPLGGWGAPWPIAVEVLSLVPAQQWTLIGGLMVQLHAAAAGLMWDRPTRDVDMVLHVKTGAADVRTVFTALRRADFDTVEPNARSGAVHRMQRGRDQVDVMIADHALPGKITGPGGRPVFRVEGGTQALSRTVWIETTVEGQVARFSVPSAFAALILKGAAYQEDPRNPGRHLEDAAVLAACVTNALSCRQQMRGSDRGRLQRLHQHLRVEHHPAWRQLPRHVAAQARATLAFLAANPQQMPEPRFIG